MKSNLPGTPIRTLPALASDRPVSADIPVSPDQEPELRRYLKVLIKYRMVVAVVIVAAILLALIYAVTRTPIYVAGSKVRISTYEPILTATKIEDMLQEKSKDTNYLQTQLEEMKSYSLADQVLDDPAVRSAMEKNRRRGLGWSPLSWFSASTRTDDEQYTVGPYRNPVALLKEYLDAIAVQPVRRTSLVTIQASSPSAEYAALFANKHAENYIEWVRRTRIEQQSRGLRFLRAQADELREKVADLEREMADYAESHSIVALNKDENITVQKMSQLNQLLTQATARRIETQKIYEESLKEFGNSGGGFEDTASQTMRSELARLESEYGELSAKYTPEYPRMKQLRAQIAEMKSAVQRSRQQSIIALKSRAESALEEERQLREELELQKSQAFELSKKQVQYNVISREVQSSRELLENVLRQIKETSLAVESNATNVSVVDFAAVPENPAYPRKRMLVLGGALAGVLLGIGLAFLLNYLDNTLRTPEDLSALLQIPSLGVVPSFSIEPSVLPLPGGSASGGAGAASGGGPTSKDRAARDTSPITLGEEDAELPIVYLNDPKSLASEAYRTIRTGILLSQAGEPPRVILVSSAQSSEGKTTSSINLAVSLASAGGQVVIMDCDLRRPSLSKHFRLEGSRPGVVEILTGQCSVDESLITGLVKRLSIIPSGCIPPNPAELLGSHEMAVLIDELAERFDYVIIDSPPVLPVTDSVLLSRFADGVVLVVRGGATPKKVALDAKKRLEAIGARILGAVLNDVDLTSGDYYYYNRYYYSYYRRPGTGEQQAATGNGGSEGPGSPDRARTSEKQEIV